MYFSQQKQLDIQAGSRTTVATRTSEAKITQQEGPLLLSVSWLVSFEVSGLILTFYDVDVGFFWFLFEFSILGPVFSNPDELKAVLNEVRADGSATDW